MSRRENPYRGGVDLLSGIGLLMLALQIAALAVAVFDLVDAAMRPAEAFVAAGKLTKPTWLVIVGVMVRS